MKLDPKKINIGDVLYHNDKGEIIVEGIKPQCHDYMIIIDSGWVYLKNCFKKE